MDTFATAITCIDGRVQQPVTDWGKLYLNVRRCACASHQPSYERFAGLWFVVVAWLFCSAAGALLFYWHWHRIEAYLERQTNP